MTKTVINVGYSVFVNHYDGLPARWCTKIKGRDVDIRMLRTETPTYSIADSTVESNLDLYLGGDPNTFDGSLKELIRIPMSTSGILIVPAIRPYKSTQSILFEQIKKDPLNTNIPNFINPKVWAGPSLGKSNYSTDTALVMKSENGACGAGQFFISQEKAYEGIVDEFEEMVAGTSSLLWAEVVDWLSSKGLTLTSSKKEPSDISAQRIMGCRFLQEFVEVGAEFRVIASNCMPPREWLLQERNVVVRDGYQQCSGLDGDMRSCKIYDCVNDDFLNIRDEVVTVINRLLHIAPVMSFDVFICKDDPSKWGMFEFSNQFSMAHFSPVDRIDFLKRVVAHEVEPLLGAL